LVGYGVACGTYKEMAYAAVVAEVALDGKRPRVTQLWCAHDCGMVVNPDGVRAQVEGNLVWSIGMALIERLQVAQGHVSAATYVDYPVPRFSDVPRMIIELVDAGDPPTGAGETAIVAGTAAITNAITAATGRPVSRLPYEAVA
jgi:isoquinoline 1-oxidoreductase beta subunit